VTVVGTFASRVAAAARARGRYVALLAALAAAGCDGRPKVFEHERPLGSLGSQQKLVVVDLTGDAPESTAAGGWFPLPPERTFAGLVDALSTAKEQPAPGYFVRFGSHSFNWAQTEELGRLLFALRGDGRHVICHADGYSNASMWLAASACDEIWLSPAGNVDTVGIAGQTVYLKRLLDKLHIKADFLHVGRYKAAAENITQDGPSDAAKESMEAVLGSIRAAWVAGVKEHRKEPRASQAIENGPWIAKAAVGAGLVDAIGYEQEARKRLEELTERDEYESAFGAIGRRGAALDIAEVVRAITGGEKGTHQPHVAILPAAGGISMEQSGTSDEGISADRWTKLIRDLKNDDAVKAVVLRLDSPGGSALASDLLWHELMQLREKKPLVASVGNMAASGGYYLASAANTIFAEQTSIVGSIGVVGGKIVLGEALDELGVSSYTFTANKEAPDAGARAAYGSVLTEWDEPTRQRVQQQMEAVYDLFISRVVEGRGMPEEKVRVSAEGRIWTGTQGKERGLVDEFGGLAAAVADAKQRAGLPPDAPVSVEGPTASLLTMLGLDEDSDPDEVQMALRQLQAARPAWLQMLPSHFESVAQGLSPMLRGERVLTIVPYAFDSR